MRLSPRDGIFDRPREASREGAAPKLGEIHLDLVAVPLDLAVTRTTQLVQRLPRRLFVRQMPADRRGPLTIVMVINELVNHRGGLSAELNGLAVFASPP